MPRTRSIVLHERKTLYSTEQIRNALLRPKKVVYALNVQIRKYFKIRVACVKFWTPKM